VGSKHVVRPRLPHLADQVLAGFLVVDELLGLRIPPEPAVGAQGDDAQMTDTGGAVADLRLSGPGARPDLTGTVKLEEMWLKLPFSRLNITEGVVSFSKEQPFDPQINITGESITGSRMVQVFVQGRALDPKVRLTSSPPLPEGEIASLLQAAMRSENNVRTSEPLRRIGTPMTGRFPLSPRRGHWDSNDGTPEPSNYWHVNKLHKSPAKEA